VRDRLERLQISGLELRDRTGAPHRCHLSRPKIDRAIVACVIRGAVPVARGAPARVTILELDCHSCSCGHATQEG
jgi:hypothetical protein